MDNNCWMYGGKCLEFPPEGYYGFIYKITDDQGRVYFGKKAFEYTLKKTISKKARKLSGTKKRIERKKVTSGWLDYWGSSKPLLEYIDNFPSRLVNFKREILILCVDKVNLSYWEMVTLVKENVLFRADCYNSNVSGKYFKGKVYAGQ